MKLVPAKDVRQAFRKRTGEYVYLRLSESSVKFLKLDETKIYGVCFNGNVAVVDPDKLVVEMPLSAILDNHEKEEFWERMIGVKIVKSDQDEPE